jgi:hypothetical protein
MRYGLRLPLASPRAPSGFIETAAALSTRTCWSKRCRGSEAISWAWPDLNQRPHPYKRSTAARHATSASPQATGDRTGPRDAFLAGSFQAVRASQAVPQRPSGTPAYLHRPLRRPGPLMLGPSTTRRDGPGPGRHRTQRRHPRTWPRAQRQPQPLRRAIPTLTGAVLVVNAAGTSSSALQAESGSPHETWLEPT